jgi:hypothetical protein
MDTFDYLAAADPLSSIPNPTDLATGELLPDDIQAQQAQMLGRILFHVSDHFCKEASQEVPEEIPLSLLRLLKTYHLLKTEAHTKIFQENTLLAEKHNRLAELHKKQADAHNLHSKRLSQAIETQEKDLLWRDTHPDSLVDESHPASQGVAAPEAWVPKKRPPKIRA